MKKLWTHFLVIMALAFVTHPARAVIRHLTPVPNASAPAPITRTAHLITIKNVFNWNDALEADHVATGDGFETVNVNVTNCSGFGPLPDPMKLKTGQNGLYDGRTSPLGFNGSQCYDQSLYKMFGVTDLAVNNGSAALYTRAEYKTSIGKDMFDIPELPERLVFGGGTYEFSRVWNGLSGQSAYIAFVNSGEDGNVTLTAIEDPSGVESLPETIHLPRGDTFVQMLTFLRFGRVRITVPPISFGCPGCTSAAFTPKIYAVIFRGYSSAGVAKAIVPVLKP